MIHYLLILIGILLIILGLYQLTRFVYEFSIKIKDLSLILSDSNFDDYKTLRLELDELNYSYYEILNELEERLSKLEQDKFSSPIGIEQEEEIVSEHVSEAYPISDKQLKEEKGMIRSLIDQGFGDPEIAKILNVGTGKVALIRKLYHSD